MKKNLITFILFIFSLSVFATDYYVNPEKGSDKNDGKSPEKAIKSLSKAAETELKAGDKLLLAKGFTHKGSLTFFDLKGTAENPIVISSYNPGSDKEAKAPKIDAKGHRNGILLLNCSYVKVKNLKITANGGGMVSGYAKEKDMRCGVLITTNKQGNYGNITLSDLQIKDIFYEDKGIQRSAKETHSANGTQNYGWGIRFINRTKDAILENLTVKKCKVKNVAHTGIKFTGRELNNIKVLNNKVTETGGPGIQLSGANKALIKGNKVNFSGSNNDGRKWGRGSGLWTWGCNDILIEHNSFRNANGPGDSAGCHIDFNCKNVIVQYNVSENNAGGFCEILGNNYNCAYRYNVSINDGHRVKKKGIAFQEGKIFWLSGYVGSKKKRHGPYNSYFYNNTIYVKSDIVAKVAITKTAKGVLIANNIFYIEGNSQSVLGDQYNPEKKGKALVENLVFKNNLFLRAENWPKDLTVQDEAPVIGNPEFSNMGGTKIKDYIPKNKKLIKNKGIKITNIPGDEKGIYIGLNPKYDIRGNKIKGLPDMGAIEIK